MKSLIVYEKWSGGWGAYAPDLPGLGVVGRRLEETKQLIREAIEFHLEGMRHDDPIPDPVHKPNASLRRGPQQNYLVTS
jgi:predicted RNase H-like HicB family nuclease